MPRGREVPQPVLLDRAAHAQIELRGVDQLVGRPYHAGGHQVLGVVARHRAVRTVHVEGPSEGVAARARDDVDDRRSHLGFTEVAEARDHHLHGLDGIGPILRRTGGARPDSDAADLKTPRFRPGRAHRAVRGEAAVHGRHQDRRDVGGRARDGHVGQDFLVDRLRLPRALDIDNRACGGDGDGLFHRPTRSSAFTVAINEPDSSRPSRLTGLNPGRVNVTV